MLGGLNATIDMPFAETEAKRLASTLEEKKGAKP